VKQNVSTGTLIADLVALTVSIGTASVVVLGTPLPWASTIAVGSTWPMIALLYVGAVLGSLLARQLWHVTVGRPSYVRAFLVAASAIGVVAIGVLTTRMYWSRPFLLLTLVVWVGLMLVYRSVWRVGPWEEKYLVITVHKELADELAASPHAEVIGVLSPNAESVPTQVDQAVTVLVDAGTVYSDVVSRFVADARRDGSPIRPFADVYEEHMGKASITHANQGWDAPISIQPQAGYLPLKRVIDVSVVILIAPIAIVATAIGMAWVRIDSRGDPLFHQRRVGKNGVVFVIHKIRTMTDTQPTERDRTADKDVDRITGAGRVLRRLRIDELPQLWNVLKGDLSIVGPRPEQVQLALDYGAEIPFYSQRHAIRPGITGWAQVHHGYAAGIEETIEKLGYDLFYLKYMSIWLDLRILGRSVWTVLTGFGAK